ncbi:MAG TPA: flagellar basal body rod protein FlgB [Ruminiclostridium sp.]|uniref:Flagellar basal body rod protein FlgB n=1 Tax=Acetivibrio saccincola TaxID=1677857 RepID=A0A2K9ER46_9FIRM|nr:flagellar basal body rod protein FlgB [Acetivibrio saccincola]HAA43486.1 flagellar basal body rod protein FlgB [Ruminiclostridium sp.]AUG57980.1 Flagellar basal body rod protein FlgB [Acetivibrio saccincola]NLW27349.1 flagellar basal body rod protein FlgB [Acetivibrio saccincola]PQQ67872.1 flagellar basal-body rod protein FlgB [Acetivibrio saccincola]HOA97228.1 flagellar basal body rod protein FlgB [Acetivibrio saccincola]
MLERILYRTKPLEKTLDAALLRNEAISQNISNVDTPDYKRKTVVFEEYLNDALGKNSISGIKTDHRHIPIGARNFDDIEIRVSEDKSNFDMRLDGNNVDIDSEMVQLAKNAIKYEALIQRISSDFRRIKSVINEGRR